MESPYVFFIEFGCLILVEGVIVKKLSSYVILEVHTSQLSKHNVGECKIIACVCMNFVRMKSKSPTFVYKITSNSKFSFGTTHQLLNSKPLVTHQMMSYNVYETTLNILAKSSA
jgi:hypothetical protein